MKTTARRADWLGEVLAQLSRVGYILPPEPLHTFDPRRNFQLQGFTGRGATTTIHDATKTGVSTSGIFQAAEDFAVLGWWNAYDYYNHPRLKTCNWKLRRGSKVWSG